MKLTLRQIGETIQTWMKQSKWLRETSGRTNSHHILELYEAIQNLVPNVFLEKPEVSTSPESAQHQQTNNTQKADSKTDPDAKPEPVLSSVFVNFFLSSIVFSTTCSFFVSYNG